MDDCSINWTLLNGMLLYFPDENQVVLHVAISRGFPFGNFDFIKFRFAEPIIAQDSCYFNLLFWKLPKLYPGNTFFKRAGKISLFTNGDAGDIIRKNE